MSKKIIKIKFPNHQNIINQNRNISKNGCGCNKNIDNETLLNKIDNKKENIINKLNNRKIFL
jgi:hypothetical protein